MPRFRGLDTNMIDVHCHLNLHSFDEDSDEVAKRAFDAGVKVIVNTGTSIPSSRKAIELANKYDHIFAIVGVHPHHVFEIFKKNRSSATQIFQKTYKTEKFVFASDLNKIKNLGQN